MGNPCRYIFQDTYFVRRPEINKEKKEVILMRFDEKEFDKRYEEAKIDLYSAPDVIMSYTNGNNCKDEFLRLERFVFKDLKLVKQDTTCDESVTAVFSYDECKIDWFNYNDPETETNIPVGKFAGMTHKQVQDYRRKNRTCWQKSPEPSQEAITAAYETQLASTSQGEEAIKEILKSAYKIDL